MRRPGPRNRMIEGMMPAEKALAIHVSMATAEWPKESRKNLIEAIVAALDEAREDGVDATLAMFDGAYQQGVDALVALYHGGGGA